MTIYQQISEFIKSSKCTFKAHSNTLNVIEVSDISILNFISGDFGEWNANYNGIANLTTDDGEMNEFSKLYEIKGYAKTLVSTKN